MWPSFTRSPGSLSSVANEQFAEFCGRNERNDVFQIPFRASFAHEQMHSEPQFFTRFFQLRAFVIGAHAGQRIGIQIFPAQTGRVPINHLAFAGANFRELAFHPEKNAGIIHQLGDPGNAVVARS